jgi:RecA/RadA recombinase
MERVAATFKGFRQATEVLTKVQAVPTIFPQYDIATRVMGHPISRFCRLHGPSNEGKTTFTIGMLLSFLRCGHFAALADAEHTTPPEWLTELMGDYLYHPAFTALPVETFESTVESTRSYCEGIASARERGDLPPETSGLIVIDSIRKLVPKDLLKLMLKEGIEGEKLVRGRKVKSKGVDGRGGRAAQYKAMLNTAWCDELTPLLNRTKTAMIVIARETEGEEGKVLVGGGSGLYYDSSLDLRVTRSFISDEVDKRLMLGERHRIEVQKTKIGRKEYKYPFGYFHTSNGAASPVGFDRARDALELAIDQDVVKAGGGSYRFDGKMFGKGEAAALKALRADPGFLAAVELESRKVASSKWETDASANRDE